MECTQGVPRCKEASVSQGEALRRNVPTCQMQLLSLSLLHQGRELLKKDNLLDENAPEEQQTVEELAEQLNSSVKVLQTRYALPPL